MAATFLSDVLIHQHQGLLSSSPNVDVNQIAVELMCFKNALPCTLLCKCYKGVCDNQTRDGYDHEDDDDE